MNNIDLDKYIRKVPNFPHDGILFFDITSLLNTPDVFSYIIDKAHDLYKDKKIDAIAGIESRGFFFAAPLALKMGLPFIPVRKAGKLPGKTLKSTYNLEYGTATIEIHEEDVPKGKNVLLVDDLLATGGTLKATADMFKGAGANVEHIFCVIGLPFLPYLEKLNEYKIETLINYNDEKM